MNIWKITTVALATALGLLIAGPGIQPVAADEQPLMHKAVDHLEAAEKALDKANSDKGGHRVKALRLTRDAIKEAREGIRHDNKHDGEKKDKDQNKPQ
ncbi:MAG: hypothetical protein MUF64_22300 [Polyangiaceae bacterium]|nr:hypothetical protein [Polyangiaceae bacterium]